MGQLGDYIGLTDRDGKPIHIGQVIRLGQHGSVFGRVWYMPPEVVARRVDEHSGEMLEGSYSLVDWGYGESVPEFQLIEDHPATTWRDVEWTAR